MTYKLDYVRRLQLRVASRKYRQSHRESNRIYMRQYMRNYWKSNPEKYEIHKARMKNYKKVD